MNEIQVYFDLNTSSKAYIIIPFDEIFPDKSLLSRLEKRALTKVMDKIKFRISATLLLRPMKQVNPSVEEEKSKLFKTGLEICKLKNENIKGFCFNNYQNSKNQMVVLSSRGIRKVSILTNLLYKARYNEALCVPEEENVTIIEKDNYIQDLTDEHLREIEYDTKDKPTVIKIAYNLLLDEKFKDQNRRRSSSISIKKYEFHAYESMDNYIPPEATKLTGNKTLYDIHETNSIQSHPKLPFFCTGGKGLINVWSFMNLRSIATFHSTNPKEVISNIKFNNFGDKLGGVDASGDMHIWKFNMRHPLKMPIYTLGHGSKMQTLDFCFLNDSSVFGHCSLY
mmetsp:Transcript_11583/g.10087  ORF Transcript_11583/g.10087 Transcript_11583/m.10087 type:complete len:338 (-) Transcript_11583:500-1513(-)